MTTLAERMDAEAARDLARLERIPRAAAINDAPAPRRDVVAVTLADLLHRELPPREMLLAPWLTTQSLSMIYAWRGVGKTHVALGVAYALACGGSFLQWHADKPVTVLYLDGEMPGAAIKQRLAEIVDSADKEADANALRIVTPDLQPDGIMPDLATSEGQAAIDAVLGDARVVIVDNISCLVRASGKENDADSWAPVGTWALRQRAHGRAVVFIHHSGKGGQQRGTSKREDVLDTVIALRHPADYRPQEGARFVVEFEKCRAMYGNDVTPFEAQLESGADRKPTWTTKDATSALKDRVIELAQLGLPQADIARELGCNRSTVMRHIRAAQADGTLPTPKKKKRRRAADDDD